MFKSVIKRFWGDKNGNIAMMTGLCALPAMALLGSGVDFVRALTVSTELQASLDGAVLAAANLNNPRDAETVVHEFIDSNLARESAFLATLNVDFDEEVALNSKTVEITASGTIETYFLRLANIDELEIIAKSTATQAVQNIEVALVLDISSSMSGNKLTNLKEAATAFVEDMLDDETFSTTSISLIPFGGTVNIGEDLFDDFAVSLSSSSTIINPDDDDYDIGTDIEDGEFRFTEGDYCIEYTKDDYDEDMLPLASRPQVPHFWRWTNFNPWCPLANSAAVFNSNDLDDLSDHIDGMTLSDGTGMDTGVLWGMKALSPAWEGHFGGDFAERPGPYDEETLKVFIVMGDGAITVQSRPEDYTKYNTHDNRPTNNTPTGSGGGNQGDNDNIQTALGRGNANSTSSNDNAVGRFKTACETVKSSGAVAFTIGFQITAGSLADSLLVECASDAGKYYLVEDLDIASAFDSIAASVKSLRITG